MKRPRVLVIDDQYARDVTEWSLFLRSSGFVEARTDGSAARRSEPAAAPVAEAVLCSGQQKIAGRVENDYGIVREAVMRGQHRGGDWALVLLDVTFDSGELKGGLPRGQSEDGQFGERVRARLAEDFPGLPVVMLTGKRQGELSDRSMPYLSKQGLDERAVRITLLRYGRLEPEQTRGLLGLDADCVAEAPGTLAAFREAFVHALSGVPVLVLGESGTGKEVLARYIHRLSARKGPFVGVNVAALPRDLLESELFGIEKGAATGVGERPGKLELANSGTLFLDEIGDMPLEAQAKILRGLQQREIQRIGGHTPIAFDITLVCATSRDLPAMVTEGRFREDLYYRINTVPITLPALRERREDIASFARMFLEQSETAAGKSGIEFAPAAIAALEAYFFPGNVRELENLVKRLVSAAGHHELLGAEAVARALGAGGATDSAVVSFADETKLPLLPLSDLPDTLTRVSVDPDDPALAGIKPRLDSAYQALLQHLVGAALERCRDPVSGALNRQRAMQLLSGNSALKGKGPARIVNEILGRRLDDRVTEADLEALIKRWRVKDGTDH